MDRGASRELTVSGMSRTNFVAALEGAAVQKGFRIIKKEYFHDSTMISAEKGSVVRSMAADMVTDGISHYTQSGNAYGMDAEVLERGGRLRLYIAVYPRTGVYERGSLLGMMDRPLLNLTLDPSSDRLLEELLDRMKERGIALEPLSVYQDRVGLQPGQKTVDDTGWTVKRSQTVQIGASSSHDYRFWGLITGIIGFVGFLILSSGFLGVYPRTRGVFALLCIGFFLCLFGIPGSILSIMAIVKSGKGKRALGIVSLVLSGIPLLFIIFLVVVLIAGFFVILQSL